MSNRNLSTLMTRYNRMKANQENGRMDRALGIVMSGKMAEKIDRYNTTRNGCECPDHKFRGTVCKHMKALELQISADVETEPEPVEKPGEMDRETFDAWLDEKNAELGLF